MPEEKIEAALYIVAMPIGNVEDLSPRARRVLSQVDCIAAEDTRCTGRLLKRLQINTALVSYHDGNEDSRSAQLLARLKRGQSLALVSDAGTPLINDPGYRLVRAARQLALPLYVVPGPSALTAALSVAGLPTDRFVFEGFLPTKAAARKSVLEALRYETRTLVFFEAPHRLAAMLAAISAIFGFEREAAVVRELSKQFESVYTGVAGDLAARAQSDENMTRGEIVVLVQGAITAAPDPYKQKLLSVLRRELGVARASKLAAEITGLSRGQLYQAILEQPDGG